MAFRGIRFLGINAVLKTSAALFSLKADTGIVDIGR